MIQDALLTFSSAQAVTTTTDSTNTIDLGIGRDLGIGGEHLAISARIDTTFTGGTSINFQLMGAPDNGSGAPGTYVVLVESGAILAANLTAGVQVLRTALPAGPYTTAIASLHRWLKMTYTVAGTFGAGALSASIGSTQQASRPAYPAAPTTYL